MREIQILTLVTIAVTAALFDLWEERIPNALTAAGLAMGFVYQLFAGGAEGILLFLGGAALPFLLFFILYVFRMIGAGDIKLLMTAGGFLGIRGILRCILCSLFAAAVIALFLVIKNRSIVERFRCLFTYIRDLLKTGRYRPYSERVDAHAKFCFAVPVVIGVLLSI